MAYTINETPVHWEDVRPPDRLPPWAEVVWISVPGMPRRLWFVSKKGLSWQQRERQETIRKGRELILAEAGSSSAA
ncbi:MAG: hypothetical protein FJ029_03475 [Actinobacteria bacterium]|nr:hypothetical protein [Actinomycetota bacterium]